MNNSYSSDETKDTNPCKMFENDFSRTPGQFTEEESGGEINLMCSIFPGQYNGERWSGEKGSDDDAYQIHIYYHSKKRVYVILDATHNFTKKEDKLKSFEVVKKAAKKFFLKNHLLKSEPLASKWALEKPTWKDIEQAIIDCAINNSDSQHLSLSWSKVMTMDEAKDLFDYLRIPINFPE